MSQSTDRDFLGTEPVGKLLWRLALPTLVAQVINMLYNIVDRIYIGHIPEVGAMALTGVGVCLPIIMIVSAFAALVGSGGAPRASIYLGQGNSKKAEKTLGNCFAVQILISIVLTTILLIWNEDLLLAFGASENTIQYGLPYMNIYAIGTIFVQITLGMNSFITAQGFAKTSMLSVLIGALTNIILDPIFIFVFDMGVKGAALATILSQALSCIWVLTFLFGKKTNIKIKPENLKLEKNIILPALTLGLATFIMQSSESVIAICFNSSLLRYGGDIAVGTMTILSSIMQMALLPLQGIGQGAQPIISYNYGAKNKERVMKTIKLLILVSFTYSSVLWLFLMITPSTFAAIFTSDPALLTFSESVIRIYCAILGLFGIQIACQMVFTSIGNAKASISVAIMRKFILLVPLIYIMPMIMSQNKTLSVYIAEPIADFISVTFTIILFTLQIKKAIKEMSK